MYKLRSQFMTFPYRVKCCECGKEITEGYQLGALTDEAWELMEKKYGDVSNWTIGECCFGGYCGANASLDANDWYELHVECLKPAEKPGELV